MTVVRISLSEESKDRIVFSLKEQLEEMLDQKLAKMQLGNPPEDPRKWRTRKEVAQLFGVSTKTVQRWEVQYGLQQDPKMGGHSAAYPISEIARIERLLSEKKGPTL